MVPSSRCGFRGRKQAGLWLLVSAFLLFCMDSFKRIAGNFRDTEMYIRGCSKNQGRLSMILCHKETLY